MNYKIIILAPSAGGKSTLMRYLREHTDLHISETDEEVLKANNNIWPADNDYKNRILVPQIAEEIIRQDNVIFFASYIPTELIKKAEENGFKVVLLNLTLDQLKKRNIKRMEKEGYEDAMPWFKGQLDNYKRLSNERLVDEIIDGNKPTNQICDELVNMASKSDRQ